MDICHLQAIMGRKVSRHRWVVDMKHAVYLVCIEILNKEIKDNHDKKWH